MRDSCGRSRDRVTLAGVAFLYPGLLATLSSLGGRIRRPCPRARQLAARARKLAGQHPFPWGWPRLFLEAQSRLQFWDEGETTLGQNCSNPRSMQAMFHRMGLVRAMQTRPALARDAYPTRVARAWKVA